MLDTVASGAVDNLIEDKNMAGYVDFTRITKLLRRELLENRARWTLSGSFDDDIYDTPMLKCFTPLLLLGRHAVAQGGKREKEVQQTVNIIIQLMLHNIKTDIQSRHKPKSNSGFRQTVQTPVTLGLQLTSHKKVRSKVLIDDHTLR